jgi:LssY C-terminus
MLVVNGVTSPLAGSGAMAVLTTALLLGNAQSLVPRLIPGAYAQAFVADQNTRVMADQMAFLIKAFFFVLIGLMFPTSPRLILVGALPVLFLLVARIPAVRLATLGLGLSRASASTSRSRGSSCRRRAAPGLTAPGPAREDRRRGGPMTRPAPGQRAALALIAAFVIGVAGCAHYRPRPLDDVPFLERAQSRNESGVRVTVAVPSDKEATALFGVSLAAAGIQPVWLQVHNASAHTYWFAPISLDPEYFTPREAANRCRFWLGSAANTRMREHFSRLAIGSYLEPGGQIAGFVFTNLERGIKVVNVDLVGRDDLRQFFFIVEIPGLRADYHETDLATLYVPSAIRDLDEPGLREALEGLPCCASTMDGTGVEDPINFALVGEADDVFGTFARAGWHVTEVLDVGSAWQTFLSYFFGRGYRSAPISPIALFGRRQDLSLQKARATARERNHLRLWLAPFRLEGRPVWVGQISRDIGLSYRPPLTVSHEVDPDVDEARNYLVQDLVRSQGVARFGWVTGVGTTPASRPRFMADGSSFFTDGLRAVMIFSTEAVGLDEIGFLDWETPPPR